jgi:hypothetical protein
MAGTIRLNGGRCAFRLGESLAARRVSKGFYDRPYVGHVPGSLIVDSSVRRPWRYGCDMPGRWCAVFWGRRLVADPSSDTRSSFFMALGQIVPWAVVYGVACVIYALSGVTWCASVAGVVTVIALASVIYLPKQQVQRVFTGG